MLPFLQSFVKGKKRFIIVLVILALVVFSVAGFWLGRVYQKYTIKSVLSQIELGESFITYFAVLSRDQSACNQISSEGGRGLCLAAFREGGCRDYGSPNRQTCLRLKLLLNKDLEVRDIRGLCNSKELEKDLEQILCYTYYASAMHLPGLCDEICKVPIDNTNCGIESSSEAFRTSCRSGASVNK